MVTIMKKHFKIINIANLSNDASVVPASAVISLNACSLIQDLVGRAFASLSAFRSFYAFRHV